MVGPHHSRRAHTVIHNNLFILSLVQYTRMNTITKHDAENYVAESCGAYVLIPGTGQASGPASGRWFSRPSKVPGTLTLKNSWKVPSSNRNQEMSHRALPLRSEGYVDFSLIPLFSNNIVFLNVNN